MEVKQGDQGQQVKQPPPPAGAAGLPAWGCAAATARQPEGHSEAGGEWCGALLSREHSPP